MTDRFIPRRDLINDDQSHFHLFDYDLNIDKDEDVTKTQNEKYNTVVHEVIFGNSSCNILPFVPKFRKSIKPKKKTLRELPTQPERMLDAPDIHDDYYLNIMSWGSNNILAVGLGPCVYFWNALTNQVSELLELNTPGDYVSSLIWDKECRYIAVGTAYGCVQVWDIGALCLYKCMEGHTGRVSSLSWNGTIISSGSRDLSIIHFDIKKPRPIARSHVHEGEICGLKWNIDGSLLAAGDNDNALKIWDRRNFIVPYLHLDEHKSAVKAIAWNPEGKDLLASGGGSEDKTLKVWDVNLGKCLKSVNTGSQVCNAIWSSIYPDEILTSHGYPHHQLMLWDYPTMEHRFIATGHAKRVVYADISPDNTTVVTAAGDETVRFWKIFDDKPLKSAKLKKDTPKKRSLNNYFEIR